MNRSALSPRLRDSGPKRERKKRKSQRKKRKNPVMKEYHLSKIVKVDLIDFNAETFGNYLI